MWVDGSSLSISCDILPYDSLRYIKEGHLTYLGYGKVILRQEYDSEEVLSNWTGIKIWYGTKSISPYGLITKL